MNRKEFLKYSGLGALALGLTPSLYCTGPGPQKQLANPSLKPTENFNPDLEVELTAVTDDEIMKLNTTEIWKFINGQEPGNRGMMQGMMQIPHPVHLHGLQFRIVERDVSEMDSQMWDDIKDGFVDSGRQDTFLLMPGMKVKIAMEFLDYSGLYIYHCHNLEHHDMGMMRNFMVENS